ncbi:tumor necrosis factor ligand superfamily member 10 isoform X2 [Delphinapterus leucas]|uniref:Tumor necrosis factor ligand superfamily member 10 isoform X2 n=2 Tax=Delphinapterus leucas TaxID=9749 RepID=A0A2Y9NEX4_DELLE|nr:tumor necrosis factor ligand superfamily member 10 isoform X2 [Delphinapterus leucas]
MALMQAPGSPSPGQTCALILIFTVLLQALCVAVTYVYFTNELKQMQDKYSKSGIACFLKDDDSSWDASDDESMINPCWHVKWQLRQFVRKIILRTYEETIPSIPEKQQNIPHLEREKGPQRVAAHITGTNRKSTFSFLIRSLGSRNENALFPTASLEGAIYYFSSCLPTCILPESLRPFLPRTLLRLRRPFPGPAPDPASQCSRIPKPV